VELSGVESPAVQNRSERLHGLPFVGIDFGE
jgi:hypothetical protein